MRETQAPSGVLPSILMLVITVAVVALGFATFMGCGGIDAARAIRVHVRGGPGPGDTDRNNTPTLARSERKDTGGLFVTTPDDDPAYGDRFLEGCRATALPVEEIDVAEALRREPRLNPASGARSPSRTPRSTRGRRSGRSRAARRRTARGSSPTTA